MKFGCCLNMVSTQQDGTGMEWLTSLKDFGYDYVELPSAQMADLSDDSFAKLADTLHALRLPCETSNNFFPATLRLTGPNVSSETIFQYVEKVLGRAKQLGVKKIVFGSGPAKNVPAGFPMEKGYSQVVQLLQSIAPMAEADDITIVIEPLRKAECNLINSFAEGVQLAQDVNHPAVKVLVDFYHMSEERESMENLRQNGKCYLHHIHFANPIGRIYPKLPSEYDYGPFFAALKAIGYNDTFSVEAYAPDGYRQDAPAALSFLRSFFAEASGDIKTL